MLKRLDGIQRSLSSASNSSLMILERKLNLEYMELLNLEEQFWASKSRVNWLNLGDANTAFFHASMINRRRNNNISSIKNPSSNWFFEVEQICILSHFKNLFAPDSMQPIQPLQDVSLCDNNHASFLSSIKPPESMDSKRIISKSVGTLLATLCVLTSKNAS